MTDAVYVALFEEARIMLRMGESVIIDVSWTANHHRELARQLAVRGPRPRRRAPMRGGWRHRGLHVCASAAGAEGTHDASDATPEVAARMARVQDTWPEALPVRTDRPADELAAALDDGL